MVEYRKYYLWISIVFVAIGFILAYLFKFYEDRGALTALIDVTLTSIALVIAILEILMLRSIAESSREAVNNALERIGEIVSVSDISKGIKTAYDIQKYLSSKSYVIAHIRMQDLKSIVIPLKNDERFGVLGISNRLPESVSRLAIDINNVDSFINGKKDKVIDVVVINGNMEELVSVLLEYESHIKSFKTKTK